jgi:phospholipid/cholesterol/gamma-HCH transport system substrate-binding protein
MFATRGGQLAARFTAGALALVLVLGLAVWWVFRDLGAQQVTAYFAETVGVYPGSDVRVLGVKVGEIDTVTPVGTQVRVTMTLDHDVVAPADAGAVVVSPTLVSDRYVQLTPAYDGGPKLVSGAVIPVSRTATPVELDQLYQSLNQLTTALGPNGANANGALSDALNTGAANLAGNGQALGQLIQQFGQATRTLSGSSGDLFSTVDNLAQFVQMLRDNNGLVQQVIDQLSSVSGFLAADKDDLAAALNELATALSQVQTFIQDNRSRIKSNVDKLASITQVLVNQRAALAEALNDFPLAADNLLGSYDSADHSLAGRTDLNEITAQGDTGSTGADPGTGADCSLAGTAAGSAVCPGAPPAGGSGSVAGSVALPLPASGPVYSSGGAK